MHQSVFANCCALFGALLFAHAQCAQSDFLFDGMNGLQTAKQRHVWIKQNRAEIHAQLSKLVCYFMLFACCQHAMILHAMLPMTAQFHAHALCQYLPVSRLYQTIPANWSCTRLQRANIGKCVAGMQDARTSVPPKQPSCRWHSGLRVGFTRTCW